MLNIQFANDNLISNNNRDNRGIIIDNLYKTILFILLNKLQIKTLQEKSNCNICELKNKSHKKIRIYYSYSLNTNEKVARPTRYKIDFCFECNRQIIYYSSGRDAYILASIMAFNDNQLHKIIIANNLSECNKTKINNIYYYIKRTLIIKINKNIKKYIIDNKDILTRYINTLPKPQISKHKIIFNINNNNITLPSIEITDIVLKDNKLIAIPEFDQSLYLNNSTLEDLLNSPEIDKSLNILYYPIVNVNSNLSICASCLDVIEDGIHKLYRR